MKRKVIEIHKEVKVQIRATLECGHKYARPIPSRLHVKKYYFCWACEFQRRREAEGKKVKPHLRINFEGIHNNGPKLHNNY